MAAQRTTTDTNTTQNLSLITYTDLTKFDSCLKYRSQILNQLSKVNSSVCGKIKQNLIIIKGIFCINQFHVQLMLPNLFQTNLKGFFFLYLIGSLLLHISLCCHAKYWL